MISFVLAIEIGLNGEILSAFYILGMILAYNIMILLMTKHIEKIEKKDNY